MSLTLFVLMVLSFFFTGYLAKSKTETALMAEKTDKLVSMAKLLDKRLPADGYMGLLRQNGAENAPRDTQIKILNSCLAAATDEISSISDGIGVGFYSRDLDAIITYGPSASFGNTVGKPIAQDHPGRLVMSTNTIMTRFGTMVRGNILNSMLPLEREGQVIGYIWVNELTLDITEQLNNMSLNLVYVMLPCFLVTFGMIFLLSQRTVRDVECIIKGVRSLRFDLTQQIPEIRGDLGEIVSSINTLATDLGKANRETIQAISALQNVMGNVEAVIYTCDPQTKKLVYANHYLCKLFNCPEPKDKICHELLYGLAEPCPFCTQSRLLGVEGSPDSTPIQGEVHNPLINRDFLVTDRLVTWHDGRNLFMEVGTDITERKALTMAEAANMAQREFLARMSHELRTPMNGVLGMTRLAMKADPPPAQLEYLKKIQSSAALLLGIINDILDFSRIEAGKLTIEKYPFKLHEMVENIRELIMPRITEKNLELFVAIAPSVPEYATGDGLRLSQVLLNLLGNSSKFTLKGSVTLSLNATRLLSGKLRLNCTVKDTGIGMSEEQQNALFKPFSQADASTSRKFGGTGLGLSISKALVELMGGRISVTSEEGQGSAFTFFVELEPYTGSPEDIDTQENLGDELNFKGYHFLLVEDNEINQEIALAILEEVGVKADVANNGKEAVEAFLRKDYALILMDVRMPVMDGLEATRQIRASSKHDAATISIIAMTANAMREDREATKEAGMNGHIAKPIDITELKNTLRQQLNK
ncbi:MAG: response regulator [Deltaproteobacteria bacterium]|jgi:signal transduction histidine kinase/CheY-like chemotaxis protein|nr:response regulator [Deltaproteobacteria bacterium]